MSKGFGIVILAIFGVLVLFLAIKGVEVVVQHPYLSMLVAAIGIALGSTFLAKKK